MREASPVTIVTPVYQMAQFVRDTIDSVFAQDYPAIEYLVMDAGSTDGTVDILREAEGRAPANVSFRWFSEPDRGTADAINKGIERSRGCIFAYLNADDTYKPGAIRTAVDALDEDQDAVAVYGDADWIAEDGSFLGNYPTQSYDADLFRHECFICQPASFIRREAFSKAGKFDTNLRFAFDYEFWIRLSRHGRFARVRRHLATSRMHRSNKTLGQRRDVLRENIVILRRHFGYAPFSHVLAYSAYLLDGRDQFFEPFEPSLSKYALSLPLGLRYNVKHPVRYAKEWSSVMGNRLRKVLE